MNLEAIAHRSALSDCYALDEDTVRIRIRTGRDITAVTLVHEDPFIDGDGALGQWAGKPVPMRTRCELPYGLLWEADVVPKYKREQYYFEIHSGDEECVFLENGPCTMEEFARSWKIRQYFKFPWINPVDVMRTPSWVADTIWCQIMPDRFARGDMGEKSHQLKKWENGDGSPVEMSHRDFFGGDLKGIEQKLVYLRQLGISGIYLTPIFSSPSHHKYDTSDYETIDPDFGTEDDMRDLVAQAHDAGIHVMVDAVFNHCGRDFFAWRDVVEYGEKSKYRDWFFINDFPVNADARDTRDGSYYSFAFAAGMPKLNTANPKVMKYLGGLCTHWVKDWGVDGIRFDVGDEISHAFIRKLNRDLKKINPAVYLLGEIWNDSASWLSGGEYDSVMNYPFMETMDDFWKDESADARQLMLGMNRCYSLYYEQVNRVLFNFVDTHDTDRAVTRCGGVDQFLQQFAMLMTMQGSPCMYYGTEVAMEGAKEESYNRRPMPWDAIKSGKYRSMMDEVQYLILVRNKYPQAKSNMTEWVFDDAVPCRLVHYRKLAENDERVIDVYLNVSKDEVFVQPDGESRLLYVRKVLRGMLQPGGILIFLTMPAKADEPETTDAEEKPDTAETDATDTAKTAL